MATTRKTASRKAAAKKAAVKAPAKKVDPEGFQSALAKEINVRLSKADDQRLAAAIRLAEAKAKCDEAGVNFRKWVEVNIEYAYDTVRKLASVGAADDPQAALADLRGRTAQSVAKNRDKATKQVTGPAKGAEPEVVAESALDTMDDAEAKKLLKAQAKKRGFELIPREAAQAALQVASEDPLERAKFAFDELSATDKMKLLEHAAAKTGAHIELMGQVLGGKKSKGKK